MSLWDLHPEGNRTGFKWFYADDAGADYFMNRWAGKPRDFQYVKVPAEVWVDGGGAAAQDEPKVSWEAGGGRFSCFLRQVPFLLEAFEGCSESDIPGCIAFSGHMRTYIFSLRTREQCVAELRAILQRDGQAIKDAERRLAELVGSAPHAVYMGKCSCQSGKLYTECCGR